MISKKSLVILLMLLVINVPTHGVSLNEPYEKTDTNVHKEMFTEQEIDKIIEQSNFEGLEVEKETTQIDNFIVDTTTIRQQIIQKNNFNSRNIILPYTVVHVKREIRSSNQDSSRTATVYVTAVFDVWNRNGGDYVRMDEAKYSVSMHDSSFRPKTMSAKAGQGSFQAVDKNGKSVNPSAEIKNYSKSYPTPGTTYGGSTGFTKYFDSRPNAEIGAYVDVTLERSSTGGSLTTIRTRASF